MHLHTVERSARPMPCNSGNLAAPALHKRAENWTILHADSIIAAVQLVDISRMKARAHVHQRVVHQLPGLAGDEGTRAVHVCQRATVAAAHLEATVCHCTFNEQPGRLDSEWLQKEDRAKRHILIRSGTRHLEVPCARKDDASMDDVVGHDVAQRTRSR